MIGVWVHTGGFYLLVAAVGTANGGVMVTLSPMLKRWVHVSLPLRLSLCLSLSLYFVSVPYLSAVAVHSQTQAGNTAAESDEISQDGSRRAQRGGAELTGNDEKRSLLAP